MLIIRPVGADVGPYYVGSPDRAPGRWSGRGAEALELTGPVEGRDLKRILQGRHPDDGRFLPERKVARRRAGWDLMFSAPKSVSLLGAIVEGDTTVAGAHGRAVAHVLTDIEQHRMGAAGAAVMAVFDHTTNAAREPHLHSHVLLANLGQRADHGWVAISYGSSWYVERRALFALYQMELRHELARSGWDLDWRIRADGMAHLADVPRAAVRATSTQSWATAEKGRFEARKLAVPQMWRARAEANGFGPADRPVASPGRAVARPDRADIPVSDDGRLARDVSVRLLNQRSAFRRADVAEALAPSLPAGAPVKAVEAWTTRFLAGCPVVREGPAPRWTTGLAIEADGQLQALIDEMAGGRLAALPAPARASVSPPGEGPSGPPGLTEQERAAVAELLGGGPRLAVLGQPPGISGFIGHAGVIDTCRTMWQGEGLTVEVACGAQDAARWEALTGLPRYRGGRPPDVLVVDRADRRPTPELVDLLGRAGPGTRLVLVEGGTRPRLTEPASAGLVLATDRLGRIAPGSGPPTLDGPGPTSLVGPTPEAPLDRGRQAGAWQPGQGRQVAVGLLERWQARWAPEAPVSLVGLGVDEVGALNAAARSRLAAQGALTGPPVVAAGRPYQAGDDVIALHGTALTPGHGARGRVEWVDPDEQALGIRWAAGSHSALRGREASAIGYGYALLPGTAARVSGPLLLLGAEPAVPRLRGRVIEAAQAAPALEHTRARVPYLSLGG